MGLFKNGIGRPSNETLRKSSIVMISIAVLLVACGILFINKSVLNDDDVKGRNSNIATVSDYSKDAVIIDINAKENGYYNLSKRYDDDEKKFLKKGYGRLTKSDIDKILSGERKLTYEDFYAKGDGKSNDYMSIRATHEFANKLYINHGAIVTVYGTKDKTYYISRGNKIRVITDVDWQGANFIIDDYIDSNKDGKNDIYIGQPIFTVTSKLAEKSRLFGPRDENEDIIECISLTRNSKNNSIVNKLKSIKLDVNIEEIPDIVNWFKELLDEGSVKFKDEFLSSKYWGIIISNSNMIAKRSQFGTIDEGSKQKEVIVVDSNNGKLLQKLQWIYNDVFSLEFFPISDKKITLKDGNFTTYTFNEVNRIDVDGGTETYSQNTSFRGFQTMYTGNVEFKNINHYLDEYRHANSDEYIEKYKAARKKLNKSTDVYDIYKGLTIGNEYHGFINVTKSSFVSLKNVNLQAHTKSNLINGGEAGTYDFKVDVASNIYLDNVSYSCLALSNDNECYYKNMKDPDKWGIMGTNFVKNLSVVNSKLNRIDSHRGVNNFVVKNSTIGDKGISLIGTGIGYLEKVTFDGIQNMIFLRDDYGATFKGRLLFKDITINSNYDISLFYARNSQKWDYGTKSYFPNVYVDGMKINVGDSDIKLIDATLAKIGKTDNLKYNYMEHFYMQNVKASSDSVYLFGYVPETNVFNDYNLNIYYDIKNSKENIINPKFAFSGKVNQLPKNSKFTFVKKSLSESIPNIIKVQHDKIVGQFNYIPTYTVQFFSNGGNGYIKTQTIASNKTVTLNPNTYIRSGYKFKEWNTKSDGTGNSYKDEASVKNMTTKNGAVVKLYAIWK